MKKLLLIDSHAILHRAYHALPKISFKRRGEPINAVYGFFSMLLKAILVLKPDYVITCFDAPGPTFRHEQFIGYQANRPKMEDELSSQIKITREAVKEAQIPLLMKSGLEADDLLGTIAAKTRKQKPRTQIIIVTGDKDLMQLVTKKTKLFLLTRGVSEAKLVGPQEVKEKLGVRPDQVVDYKALVGDPSDNYPGVFGIGPKTAEKLLGKFGSLKTILSLPENLDSKLKEKLVAGKKSALLSFRLAKIVRNAPIKLKLRQSRWNKEKILLLKETLKNLRFPSLVKRLEKQTGNVNKEEQMGLFR